MERRSRKTGIGYDKHHHSGCMQGLINMFDFRHGRPSQKLLADNRHGSRPNSTGSVSTGHELETVDGSCETCSPVKVNESYEKSTRDKMSVKELMEQEMFKQDQETKTSKSNKDSKHRRRNSWHTNKKAFEMSDVNTIKDKPTRRRHKSLSSLEVDEMMAELCTEIDNVKDAGCLNHDQTNDQLNEEKLAEATKVFVNHFVNGKNVKDTKFQPSKELIGALQTLHSNKDAFLNHLQDPNSQLVKHVENLVYVHGGQEHGKSKQQSFFWRKFKGLDRNLSKKQDHPQNGSTIVILKLAQQSSDENGNKAQSERASTNFLFTEFTRKLKNAMRKERGGSAYTTEKVTGGENLSMASPTRDHFFIEKIPRKTISAIVSPASSSSPLCSPRKDGTKIQQLQELFNYSPRSNNSESGSSSENILDDIEAKKLDFKDDCSLGEGEEESLHSNGKKICDEGYMEIERLTDAEQDKRICINTITNEKAKETVVETMEKQTMCLNLDIVEENIASSSFTSPVRSPRTGKAEDSDATFNRSDWTSPISVLEPICNEGYVSTSIKPIPASELIQPRKIKFEDQNPCLKTWEEERLSIFESVRHELQEPNLTESQLLEKFLFGENLFNQTLFDEADYVQGCQQYDPRLIYDLIKEVHDEICERGFGGISSNFKSYLSSDLEGKGVVDKIWKGVNRHLQPEAAQSTLDHTMEKDLSVSSTWMDVRSDCESIGIEVEEGVFDDLLEDTILSCIINQMK